MTYSLYDFVLTTNLNRCPRAFLTWRSLRTHGERVNDVRIMLVEVFLHTDEGVVRSIRILCLTAWTRVRQKNETP